MFYENDEMDLPEEIIYSGFFLFNFSLVELDFIDDKVQCCTYD